jgi:ribosomal-protein-alanine N-acetyltransferase
MSDAGDVQRLAGHPAVADTTLNIPHPYEHGMAENWIATHEPGFEAGRLVNFAITDREDGRLLGAIGLKIDVEENSAELGYWVGVPYWNRGYCTEAAAAVLDYAFSTLGLDRIHAHHLLRNPGSGRVMQKIGMRSEGIVRQVLRDGAAPEDLALYGLLRDDFASSGNSP